MQSRKPLINLTLNMRRMCLFVFHRSVNLCFDFLSIIIIIVVIIKTLERYSQYFTYYNAKLLH